MQISKSLLGAIAFSIGLQMLPNSTIQAQNNNIKSVNSPTIEQDQSKKAIKTIEKPKKIKKTKASRRLQKAKACKIPLNPKTAPKNPDFDCPGCGMG